jgi:EmrB/QacA subfamily drug resistance transporter
VLDRVRRSGRAEPCRSVSAYAANVEPLRYGTPQARLVLGATILASGIAFLDTSVVNVALPRIEEDLGGGVATLQWVLDAYLLTLGSLVLIGGSIGDLLGLRRVFIAGIIGFSLSSALCGLAPNAELLVVFRAVQGAAAAFMIPASLAILSSSFADEDRGRAIGLWSGLSGVTTAVGPVVGGLLVDATSWAWRLIFLINLPIAGVSLWLARRGVPHDPGRRTKAPLLQQVDVLGSLLVAGGLAVMVGGLIEAKRLGPMLTVAAIVLGALILGLFLVVERRRAVSRRPPPMMPPELFRVRSFAVANAETFVVYAALNAYFLVLTVGLQLGLGWSAAAAGAAGVPVTIILALGSSWVGARIPTVGSRILLTLGPLIMGGALLLMATINESSSYLFPVLPAVVVFAVGLTLVVAPITSTALGDIPAGQSGVGSGINNAVARIGGLLAIAAVPLAAGLDTSVAGQQAFTGYAQSFVICAALCLIGAAIAWFGYASDTGKVAEPAVS